MNSGTSPFSKQIALIVSPTLKGEAPFPLMSKAFLIRLRVKPVLLVVLLNVIDDGDAGKHALNVMLGIEHLRDNISQKPVPLRPGEVPVEA
jgi:hypothetical protein